MIDAEAAHDQPQTNRPGQPKPGPWRIADIVDGRKLRIQLTAAALDNGSDPIAQRKRALDLIMLIHQLHTLEMPFRAFLITELGTRPAI